MEDNLRYNEISNISNLSNQGERLLNTRNIINNKQENNNGDGMENPVPNYATIKENYDSNNNYTSKTEKTKRIRRCKIETSSERTFKCPDCEKCYLSGPAVINHRKLKHGYNSENEKKSRGRPKKEDQQENEFVNAQIKYNIFFNNSTRQKLGNVNSENNLIDLKTIQENFKYIFSQCKDEIFKLLPNVDNYSFYQLVTSNWNKENYDFRKEYLNDNAIRSENINNNNLYKCNSLSLDHVFFLYLKEFASKTNKNYFWFVNKFIVLLREFINSVKKELVKYETKKEYSQLYDADNVPECFNDFFLEFMQPNKYFGLNDKELIELAQHFCFWLYSNRYTHSYLTLI